MESNYITFALYALGATALTLLLARLKARLELSMAKHRSLAGHARMARRFASLIPFYEYDEKQFFRSDDAPEEIAARRRAGFMRLAQLYKDRFAGTRQATAKIKDGISDLQFTDAYRVPFQYSQLVREHLNAGTFVQSSSGVTLTDLDGNRFYDLTGAYGVNVFGYDFYKECMERGYARVRDLGPVLGPYHPVITYNVKRLREISGLDEVSLHMSGTEAVVRAVRLARYHTRRSHLVRFSGAYHGWWGDVQPGVGNPVPARETYTLEEMSEASLRVLRRRRDIACVLVNPSQAMHPNASPAADSALVDSARGAFFDRQAYTDWLKRLRAVSSERDSVDLRRGVRRLPSGARRGPGILRGSRRHGHLRQDAGRWPAGGRNLRPQPPDEVLPRRPAGGHLFCAGNLQPKTGSWIGSSAHGGMDFSTLRCIRRARRPSVPAA